MSKAVLVVLCLAVIGGFLYWTRSRNVATHDQQGEQFSFRLTDEQWRERLSPEAYAVLRREATERPNTSPLNKVKGPGTFSCAGCEHKLFSAEHKFDSGTGWPSFYQPVNSGAVETSTDYKMVVARTEVHCANCGGHLGHVFSDGPRPTGKRYCINGVALSFSNDETDSGETPLPSE